MESNRTSRFRKRCRIWYWRNKVFVAFVLTLVSTYFVANWLTDDYQKAFAGSGLFLQLWGIVITATGILSARKAFDQPGLLQLIKWLFCIREKPIIQPGSSITLRQTVLGVSPVKPKNSDERLSEIEHNIRSLFDYINEDRETIKLLSGELSRVERRLEDEVSSEVGQLKQKTRTLHISGSGLALAGLGLVAVGTVCAAVPSLF